jgi:hypothetical protein
MPEGLFLNSYNEVSERYAVLDEFNLSGVLYLTKPKSQEPIRDAVAYSTNLFHRKLGDKK